MSLTLNSGDIILDGQGNIRLVYKQYNPNWYQTTPDPQDLIHISYVTSVLGNIQSLVKNVVDSVQDVDTLKRQVATFQAQILPLADLQTRVSALNNQFSTFQSQVFSLQPQISTLQSEVSSIQATPPNQFNYIQPVNAPIITGISPTSGPKLGGYTVTINGSGFTGVTSVLFGSTPATAFTFVSDSQITATVPSGNGNVSVKIITPIGTSL